MRFGQLELGAELKRDLQSGVRCFGAFVKIPSADFVEVLASAGVRFVVIDAEHGPIDPALCQEMVRAAACFGIPAIVRIGEGEPPSAVCRYLDVGVAGIKLPNVVDAAEVRQRLASAFHPPIGTRGLAAGRWAAYGGGGSGLPALVRALPTSLVTVAQIESPEAIDHLDELLQVAELDVFMIGPTDLAAAMGYAGDRTRPEVVKAVDGATAQIVAAGKVAGLIAGSADEVRRNVDAGAGYLVVNGESMVQYGVKTAMAGMASGV